METGKGTGRPARVLVLRGGAIGDFVVTLPVLQWLRMAAPGGVIDLACHGRVAPLAAGLVTQWRDIESAVFLPLYREGAVADFLENYDLVLSFLGSDTPVAGRLKEIAGGRAISIDPVPVGNHQHVTAGFFGQMRAAGVAAPDAEESAHLLPVIEVAPEKRREGRELLEGLGVKPGQALIALHSGSGSSEKNAPAGVLAEVWAWLDEAFEDAAPVLIKGEADDELVAQVAARLGAAPPVVETPDLGVLAAVLGECALLIGHDSGVSHIAAAVGTPTVAIFVSTDPAVWAPRGPRVAVAGPTAGSIKSAVISLVKG
jgi:heptosyltransferase-2